MDEDKDKKQTEEAQGDLPEETGAPEAENPQTEISGQEPEANEEKPLEIKQEDRAEALENWFRNDHEKEKTTKKAVAKKPVKKVAKKAVKKAVVKKETEEMEIPQEETAKSPENKWNWMNIGLVLAKSLAVLMLVFSVFGNVYLYNQQKTLMSKLSESVVFAREAEKAGEEKTTQLAGQVEKLSNLVNGASVSNETTALANGQNQENKKAEENIKVAIYNGTTTAGLAKEMEATLKAKLAGTDVVALDNAKHNNYTKTSVMAIGGKTAEAQKVAQAIGAQFSILPLDENKPNADVLIVVGK